MKRDINRPTITDHDDNGPRELVTKGDVFSFLIRCGIFMFLFVFFIAITCLFVNKWTFFMTTTVIASVIAVLFFLSFFWKKGSITILFWWNYLICKRIYRVGKPSRLTKIERFDTAWDTTIELFEERWI
jgi:hypothetical protein